MNNAPADSVKKRYIFSLAVNILLCVPRLLVASLVPRALGPASYGDYQFLINNLTSVKNFLDFGTSTAFFTHNAKTEDPSTLNIQYLLWWLFQLFLIGAGIFLTYAAGVYAHIWPGQNIENVALAAAAAWLFLFAQQLVQFGDSKGLTILCQKTNLFANYIAGTILALMYWKSLLTIKTALVVYITGPVILIFILTAKFYKRYFYTPKPIFSDFATNYAYFKKYCAPLLTVTVAGFLAEFLDRWMLQKFAGSTAQGYYSLSYNWAAITLLFFNPMLNIFWRDASQLAANDKKEKIGELFTRSAKLMFVITAFISMFLAFNAKEILLLIAGKKFEGATLAFIIMIFYPLVQVYGQLTGCVYYSLEETGLYRNIGLAITFSGIISSYFILAPSNYFIPGLGLNSSGFAMKTIVVNGLGTEFLCYIICVKNNVNYFVLSGHRIMVMLCFFITCYIPSLIDLNMSLIFLTLTRFLLYTTLSAVIIVFFEFYFTGNNYIKNMIKKK